MHENHKFEDDNEPEDDKAYQGPEQRYKQRRVGNDRRQEVRFELEKENRRKIPGRRKEDKAAFNRQTYTV